jgi:hypothetical protein
MAKRKTSGGKAFTEEVVVKRVATLKIHETVAFGTRNEQASSESYDGADSYMAELKVDGDYLIGEARCGQNAAVCHVRYLAELIAFLQKIVDDGAQ